MERGVVPPIDGSTDAFVPPPGAPNVPPLHGGKVVFVPPPGAPYVPPLHGSQVETGTQNEATTLATPPGAPTAPTVTDAPDRALGKLETGTQNAPTAPPVTDSIDVLVPPPGAPTFEEMLLDTDALDGALGKVETGT